MKDMKRILFKLNILILVAMLFFSIMSTTVQASDPPEETGDLQATSNANMDVGMFIDDQATKVEDLIRNTAETAIASLRISSVAIAIIFLLVIGMKYMISSSGDRADIKKHAVAYVVGAFVLFSVPQIVALLIEVADKLFSGADSEVE